MMPWPKLALHLVTNMGVYPRSHSRLEALARIYVMVGEFDAAIDQLEFPLSKPGEMSISLLRLDPAWAPLRDHPRFKKLVETGK